MYKITKCIIFNFRPGGFDPLAAVQFKINKQTTNPPTQKTNKNKQSFCHDTIFLSLDKKNNSICPLKKKE
jgi:hypothetical protein